MKQIKKMNIQQICSEVDQIIAGKNNQVDYKFIYYNLEDALTMELSYLEIDLVCETTVKIAKTKNRILRHLEYDFWDFIYKVPSRIFNQHKFKVGKNEELLSNTEYKKPGKKILSRLLGLVQEIIELRDDHSNGSNLRRSGALKLLGKMINYYCIPFAKNMFIDSINSKNKDEQYEALRGLENYYETTEDEIEDDLVNTLNDIMTDTDDRSVASTCLQIQMNAGIIDEMTALFEMDDWKEEHYK